VQHIFGPTTHIVTTTTRVLDYLTPEERHRLETAGKLANLGPADPQSRSPLSKLSGRPLDALLAQMDLQTLGRLACTCRLFARMRWPIIDVKKRSRERPGWESAIPFIVSKQPSVLRLPGNPDRQHPTKKDSMAQLVECTALQIVR
jgi:hypothetical protein